MSLNKLRELAMDREAWHAAVHGVTKSWTRQGICRAEPWLPWGVGCKVLWMVLKGVKPPLVFGGRTRDCSPGHAGKEGPQLARTGASQGFSRAASPPGSPIPGILQARTLEWGAISFSNV